MNLICICGALILAAGTAMAAQPRFAPVALPAEHVYAGGWEFFVGGGAAVFDCDGDGLEELFVAGGAGPARLFLNRTEAPGAPIRFAAGPEGPEGLTGAYPLDVDSDGIVDLALLAVGPNRVWRGLGGCRFEEAAQAWGIDPGAAWTTAFSATWEAGEAWPTLAFGTYVDRDDPKGPFEACGAHALFRPEGQGYGAPIPLTPGFCTLSMLFSDWDRRGAADLRVSNDRHYYVRGGAEQMWRLSPLRPLGAEDGWRGPSIWGMGIASEDLDGDRRPDVALTSMGDQLLMFNRAEGFVSAPYAIGTYAQRPHAGEDGRPSTGWHAEFGDVDNDGRADLFIAKGNVEMMPENAMQDPNNLLMQRADGTFREASVAAGVASFHRGRGAALADLNLDGRLDLVVVNRRAPLEVWENRTEGGGFVALDPRQDGPNGFAIGAWVELRPPEGTAGRVRERTVGGGHAGGRLGPMHFGLGGAEAVEVRVTWPDGVVSDWARVEAGRQAQLRRGKGTALEVR